MAKVARFRVKGQLDGTGAMKEGTATIYRDIDRIEVRPLGSREVSVSTFSSVCTFVCQKGLRVKAQEEKTAKKLKRMGLA
jgi:hypothetical protein